MRSSELNFLVGRSRPSLCASVCFNARPRCLCVASASAAISSVLCLAFASVLWSSRSDIVEVSDSPTNAARPVLSPWRLRHYAPQLEFVSPRPRQLEEDIPALSPERCISVLDVLVRDGARPPLCFGAVDERGQGFALEVTTTGPNTTTTTTTATTTTTTAAFYMMPFGDASCPRGLTIAEEPECAEAVQYLGLVVAPAVRVHSPDFPSGCSARIGNCASTYCVVYNTFEASDGDMDLAPVCRTTVMSGSSAAANGGQFGLSLSYTCCTTSRISTSQIRFTSIEYEYRYPTTTSTTRALAPNQPTPPPTRPVTPAPTLPVTTTTTTTSVTTLYAIQPCAPPCHRIPVVGCHDPLEAGQTCSSSTIGSSCIEQMVLVFTCPADNNITDRQPIVTRAASSAADDIASVKCQVCDLELSVHKDIDPRVGFVMMEVEFGPNLVGDAMSENEISMYSVFLTDEYGSRILDMPALANVSSLNTANETLCCDRKAYRARVTAELPVNVSTVRLEVVPVMTVGNDPDFVLPAGRITDAVRDWKDTAFARASARRNGREPHILLICCFVILQCLLTHGSSAHQL